LVSVQNVECRALSLEGGVEFLKYAINIEKASMINLSPVQKENVNRKWLGKLTPQIFRKLQIANQKVRT
jgi:hypothetical protein